MPNPKTDKQGFNTSAPDVERDLASKGGPATGTGIPDDKHGASAPYDEDTLTQLSAKGTEQKKKKEEKSEDC